MRHHVQTHGFFACGAPPRFISTPMLLKAVRRNVVSKKAVDIQDVNILVHVVAYRLRVKTPVAESNPYAESPHRALVYRLA